MKIETTGQIVSNAICLGDVDNDGNIELCIGNSLGVLNIYKDSNLEPWRQCLNLGNIVAITVGDLFNNGEKAMVVISADGHLKGMEVSVYVEKNSFVFYIFDAFLIVEPKKNTFCVLNSTWHHAIIVNSSLED